MELIEFRNVGKPQSDAGENPQKNTYKIQNTAKVWNQEQLREIYEGGAMAQELVNFQYTVTHSDRLGINWSTAY